MSVHAENKMNRYICIHGHFYQPPRENPWLEAIEMQDSASPYHDWNERIAAECYEPNMASRILDGEKRIIGIVSNYSKMSFNFGSTLLSWLESYRPEVYGAILDADRESRETFSGHGSAIAQVYNHIIMPLANRRDKITQIRWGLKDFTHRFKRRPEGMWLAETAVDTETLELLSEAGIAFTILSPYQAKGVRRTGGREWTDVNGGKINTRMPYVCPLPSGRKISIFFYDGPISHDLSFSTLLIDGKQFADRLMSAFFDSEEPQLVHVATDGETYGHHYRFSDMALAFCLHHIETSKRAEITIYGEYLEKHPPTHEVDIIERSSWSCIHGVDRWWSNCGCNSGAHPEWNQEWRTPLRNAMDWLRDRLAPIYENELSGLLKDPWQARDDYIQVILDRASGNIENYILNQRKRELSQEEYLKVLKLLEMQRHALLMFTSCGWFFDEISGIETTQVMQYADRAMQLAKEVSGIDLEQEYIEIISSARSNIAEYENGKKVYELFVKPARIDLLRVGAHYAISSVFEEYPEKTDIYCYTVESVKHSREESGRLKLATGQAHITSKILGNKSLISFAILHLGDHNLNGGVREYMDEEAYTDMEKDIKEAFIQGDVAEVIRKMDEHFGVNSYSLRELFRDEQRKILRQVMAPSIEQIETALNQTYEQYYPVMNALKDLNFPLPHAFQATGEFIINRRFQNLLEGQEIDLEEIERTIRDMRKFSFPLYRKRISYVASNRITKYMEMVKQKPEDVEFIATTGSFLKVIGTLHLELDQWKAQNIYFDLCSEFSPFMEKKAENGDENAKKWLSLFDELGDYLMVRCV
jgi:alpha-amylase/alpha-mannosidase (GH57 family)